MLRDIVVKLGTSHKADARPNHPVRVILVKAEPHRKRGGRKGDTAGSPSDGILRIATDLLDVPAEIIADIYKHRWSIELFFRFFKHVLGCRHLLSTHPAGIQIQAYCAIIACLLIHLWTGGKPTLRTFEMLCLYLQGWATSGGGDGSPGEAQGQVEGAAGRRLTAPAGWTAKPGRGRPRRGGAYVGHPARPYRSRLRRGRAAEEGEPVPRVRRAGDAPDRHASAHQEIRQRIANVEPNRRGDIPQSL